MFLQESLLAETAFDDEDAERITSVPQGLAASSELEVDTYVVENILMYAICSVAGPILIWHTV